MADHFAHLIERLQVILDMPGRREEAERSSRQLWDQLQRVLLPDLETTFDRLAGRQEYLRLESLMVELEWRPGRESWQDLMQAIGHQVVEQLTANRASIGEENKGSAAHRYLSGEQSLQTLQHYLQTGYYPWWWQSGNWAALEAELAKLAVAKPEQVREFRTKVGFANAAVRSRFIHQLSPRLQEQFLTVFLGTAAFANINRLLQELHDLLLVIFPEFRAFKTQAIADFLLFRIGQGSSVIEPKVARQSATAFWVLSYALPIQSKNWQKRLLELEKNGKVEKKLAATTRKTITTLSKGYLGATWTPEMVRLLDRLELPPATRALINNWKNGRQELPEALEKDLQQQIRNLQSSKENASFPEEGLYLSNAGLVLLHPYLLLFLRKLGLCEGDTFVSVNAREKAVHLMQYLASRKTRAPEAEMILNKVLCGLPLDEPIKRRVLISKKMKQEADHLLEVVVNYWKAMGSTSIDGLRANFLMREGKLIRTSDSWKLIVERKPQDLLLNKLPWGFSLVKLPWMDEKMFVEW